MFDRGERARVGPARRVCPRFTRRGGALLILLLLAAAATGYRVWSGLSADQRWQVTTGLLLRAASNWAGPAQVDPTALRGLELPEFHLRLSKRDVGHFADLYLKYEDPHYGLPYYTEHNGWRKAALEYNGRTYHVRISAHGRQPDGHRDGPWISYTVKLDDHEQIFNAPGFNLIIFKRAATRPARIASLCDWFGVVTQRDRLISLNINGWGAIPYYFEPRFDLAFFESTGHASWVPAGDPQYDEQAIRNLAPVPMADRFMPPMLRQERLPQSQEAALLPRFLSLQGHIAAQQPAGLEEFFDLDYIAAFEAVRLLDGINSHGWTFGNLLLYYDTSGGLFYPVYHRDFQEGALDAGGRMEAICDANPTVDLTLARLLCRNDRIRQAKYRCLWPVVSAPQTVEELRVHFTQLNELERRLCHRPHWFEWLERTLCGPRRAKPPSVVANAVLLRDYIGQSAPKTSVAWHGRTLLIAVAPQSMSALGVETLRVTGKFPEATCVRLAAAVEENGALRPLLQSEQTLPTHIQDSGAPDERVIELGPALHELDLCDGVDANWERAQRTFYFVATFPPSAAPGQSPGSPQVSLRNRITGQLFDLPESPGLEETDDRLAQLGTLEFPTAEDRLTTFMRDNTAIPFQRSPSGALVIPAGEHQLDHDLVLPRGTDLVIVAGVTLRLAEGVSLAGFGGLEVGGTAEAPVTVTALSPEHPFGTFAMCGNRHTRCEVRHLRLSQGSEAVVAGVYFSGALSLYHHDEVRITDSIIADNHADDGTNIKFANVLLESSRFENNHADQVDLDICSTLVRDCVFSAPSHPSYNGDGLDVSTSDCWVYDCRFVGLADKGLSIGERSRVLADRNTFERCHLAIAVKDSSCCYLADNRFGDNPTAVFAYKKKSLWEGGKVYLLRSARVEAPTGFFADAASAYWQANVPEPPLVDGPAALHAQLDDLTAKVERVQQRLGVQYKKFEAPPPAPSDKQVQQADQPEGDTTVGTGLPIARGATGT